jgi:hypothetical protein
MLALPIDESASSSLPTPKARDHKDQTFPPHLWIQNEYDSELPKAIARQFLPTPHAGLGERGRDGVYPNPKGQQDLQHTLAHLLPTPAVMDMGSNYTPEEWQAWKHKQRAAHNNGNGHGASLTQEALTMLPTPRSRLEGNQHYKGRNKNNLEDVAELFGESTPQPSPDGKLF